MFIIKEEKSPKFIKKKPPQVRKNKIVYKITRGRKTQSNFIKIVEKNTCQKNFVTDLTDYKMYDI